ncbi:peptidase [Lysobacter ciconiae]|uniref:Peptidase n=1 Tax=Novilysobacter ciconiae TaxID=2781022 RepID=A0A7S6ZTE7_9GAMM|nr:M13-type metalloendopeptidase [Lysobacter ciconiae]QOW20868.1 peptidase [Lysobacter ciconiae]
MLLPLAVTLALAGCGGSDTHQPTSNGDAAALTLDESKLLPVNRFSKDDIDPNVDACVAFNDHVNGTWLAANDIPGDRTSWGSFEVLTERSTEIQRQLAEQAAAMNADNGVEKIVGDLWATGMDEAAINAQGIAPIQPQLDAIAAIDSPEALADYLHQSAATGDNVLFRFYAGPDFKDSAMNIAYASQGGLGLPDKSYYFEDAYQDKLAAYQAHVAKVLELSGVDAAKAAEQAGQVVAFETRLADASKSRVEMSRDAELRYNPVSLADAEKVAPAFGWSKFFDAQGVAAPEMFSLAIPAFHAEVGKMIAEVPVDEWQAYLSFRTVDRAAPYLSDDFVQQDYDFYAKTLRGQKELRERGKRVLDTIGGHTGEALGQMYVDVAFPAESKAQMEKLVDNLRASLKTRLENLAWMGEDTKKKALEKWASFTPKIGYPDQWRDWSGLDTSRDSYIANVHAANEFNYKWNVGKIGRPVDRSEWGMSPQTVNAYYRSSANEIVFPAAILQPPFFDPDASDELNYGGIGAVIGHEMIHGYDDQGSRFGPTGNFENWWTEEDAAGFKKLTDQLIAQFNGYEAAPGQYVNGKLTLGENIADLGGLAVALDAMHAATADTPDPMTDGMSRDQRFFANWATVWRRNFTSEELNVRLATDSHAPANFRAMAAPSNMPSFAAAYSCTPGQPMVRDGDDRIVIW